MTRCEQEVRLYWLSAKNALSAYRCGEYPVDEMDELSVLLLYTGNEKLRQYVLNTIRIVNPQVVACASSE